jgi:predicted DNA-binding transcriptional regulator AlpA
MQRSSPVASHGRYLTSKDVQAMLFLSRTRIEQLRRADPAFPKAYQPGGPGGQLLFLTADVIAWAESRKSPVASSSKKRQNAGEVVS